MPQDGPVYPKFYVSRVDGRDQPGRDKSDAKYFVLDYVYDEYAKEAMMFYAFKCAEKFPLLACDIWAKLEIDPSSFATPEMLKEINEHSEN